MICLTLNGPDMKTNLQCYQRNKSFIDLAELRLDFLDTDNIKELDEAKNFPSKINIPVILTLRRKQDCGMYEGEENRRFQIIKYVSSGKFSFVDIESDIEYADFEDCLRKRDIRIIRSFHCFNGIPENLSDLAKSLASSNDIPKVAVTPKSVEDIISIFKCASSLSDIGDKIIVAMGDYGIAARILYKRLGSMLTYCCDTEVAPGIISAKTMKQVYRADRIGQNTSIYGLIGNPVKHSVSPIIHNKAFNAVNSDSVYVPFLTDDVKSFFKLSGLLNIRGFSVTAPFKYDVISILNSKTKEVLQVSACNTVVKEQGFWMGSNTDYFALEALIIDEIRLNKIKKALVIGAGGAARTIVYALTNLGVGVTILNRTVSKAEYLAKLTDNNADCLENASKYSGKVDLIVQATSSSQNLIEDFEFEGHEVALDLVYNPVETEFLKKARAAGCRIITGLDFVWAQGKLQFKAFTGCPYPAYL